MLLLRLPLDLGLLELSTVCVGLHLPLAVLVLFQLALLEELSKQVLRLERLLSLSLLKLKSLLEISVLPLQLVCSLCFAKLFFFQLSDLGSSAPALRPNLQHVDSLPVRSCKVQTQ